MRRALAFALAAVALAGCGQGEQRSPASPRSAGAAPDGAVRLFAVLRSPSAPGDALPSGAERAIRRHSEGGDPAGARRAGPSLWVVPGKRAVCLVYATRRLVNAGCAPLSIAARGLARQSLAGSDYGVPEGRKLVYGIVPDGVRAVEVDLADRAAAITLPIRRNVWRTVLDAHARGWLRAGGERMPLP